MFYDRHLTKKGSSKVKVILAFSGGLDASFCVKYLLCEKHYDVHTITVNTGGFCQNELLELERRAYQLGATSHQSINSVNLFLSTIYQVTYYLAMY